MHISNSDTDAAHTTQPRANTVRRPALRRYGSTFFGITLPSMFAAGFAAFVFTGVPDDPIKHLDLSDRAAMIKQAQTTVVTN